MRVRKASFKSVAAAVTEDVYPSSANSPHSRKTLSPSVSPQPLPEDKAKREQFAGITPTKMKRKVSQIGGSSPSEFL